MCICIRGSEQIERDTTFDLSTLHTISGFAKGTYPTAEFLLRVWDNVVCMEAHGIDIPQEISSIRTEIDDFVRVVFWKIAPPDPGSFLGGERTQRVYWCTCRGLEVRDGDIPE